MTRIAVPSPISGGVFLSYRCNSRCRYCMYACSPDWSPDWISEEDLTRVLSQLSGKIKPSPYGSDRVSLNYGLHFTGGEPFLNFDLLLKAVEIANELEIPSTFVETNCYWCVNDEITREKLMLLKSKGLRGILISVNPFYLEYIPFSRTERAIRISREVFKGNVMVYQVEYYFQFKELGIKGILPFDEYLKMVKPGDIQKRVELFLTGRAAYKLKDFYPKYPANYFLDKPCQPPFLRNWHNHIDNYSNYLPGYCGGLSLGDARKLNLICKEGVDADSHPILRFLAAGDFEGLFQFATKDFGYEERSEGYVSKCHLCLDMRKHLAKEGFEELTPKEFYLHLE